MYRQTAFLLFSLQIIGRPFLPPYWALGFHLCRWGYNSSKTTWDVVKRMRRFGVPHDVQWNDIDYMHAHLDFTYNHTTFASLPQMVDDLHAHNQKYIMIVARCFNSMRLIERDVCFFLSIRIPVLVTSSRGVRTRRTIEASRWESSSTYQRPRGVLFWAR